MAAFAVRSADGHVGERRGHRDGPRVREADAPGQHPALGRPEGESELVLTVRDEVSAGTFEAREPFRVEEALASGSD
jgi:hypothetical protein